MKKTIDELIEEASFNFAKADATIEEWLEYRATVSRWLTDSEIEVRGIQESAKLILAMARNALYSELRYLRKARVYKLKGIRAMNKLAKIETKINKQHIEERVHEVDLPGKAGRLINAGY